MNALLTGGIFAYRDLGISGVGFTNIIDARRDPSTGIFHPFAVVRGRNVIPTSNRIHDEDEQYVAVEQTVEVRILDDPTSTKAVIDSAIDRLYLLLQFRPVAGAFQCELIDYYDARDYDFSGARAMAVEWLITGKLSPS